MCLAANENGGNIWIRFLRSIEIMGNVQKVRSLFHNTPFSLSLMNGLYLYINNYFVSWVTYKLDDWMAG
jgi:hypothetical protein